MNDKQKEIKTITETVVKHSLTTGKVQKPFMEKIIEGEYKKKNTE